MNGGVASWLGLGTVGWFKPFVTDELDYNAKASPAGKQVSTLNLTIRKHEYYNRSELLALSLESLAPEVTWRGMDGLKSDKSNNPSF